jgi:predicted metal-dependent phosphoesterase TrpH
LKRLDLHVHSTASDGTMSPGDLVRVARLSGLAGLALCDHDTVDGLGEFMGTGKDLGFPVFGGVELSLEFRGVTHMLGLGVDGSGSVPELDELKRWRLERNRRLHERLGALGVRLDWERLLELSAGGQMGRPHFARAMVEAGFSPTLQQAFDTHLRKGRPGYVAKIRLDPRRGLGLLRKNGFAPVLAHPVSLGIAPGLWPDVLARWRGWGLAGLEAWHPDQDEGFSAMMAGLARRFGLVATAGSDFHGANKRTPINWVASRGAPVGLGAVEALRAAL